MFLSSSLRATLSNVTQVSLHSVDFSPNETTQSCFTKIVLSSVLSLAAVEVAAFALGHLSEVQFWLGQFL